MFEWMKRKLTNINFPTTSLGVGGPVIAQLQGLKFGEEPGMQMVLGYRCDQWFSIEGRYLGLNDWSDSITVTDPQGRLFGVLNGFGTVQQPVFPSPPFPPTFGTGNNTTSQSGGYSSRLNTWEINGICDLISFDLSARDGKDNVQFSIAGLAGIRYIRLIENFFVSTKGDIIPAAGIDDPNAFTDYNINARTISSAARSVRGSNCASGIAWTWTWMPREACWPMVPNSNPPLPSCSHNQSPFRDTLPGRQPIYGQRRWANSIYRRPMI